MGASPAVSRPLAPLAATTADDHPDLTASAVLRGIAAGLANYRREPRT